MTFRDSFHQRRAERDAAAAADDALSGVGPAPAGLAAGIEAARSLGSYLEVTPEPPRSALVAMRAGLANRQRSRAFPEKRRIAAMLAVTAAAVAGIGGLTMRGGSHPASTYQEAQGALGNLSKHVQGLESALESGDPTKVRQEIVAASQAADEAQTILGNLPQASSGPSDALAVEATKQRIQDVHWLVNAAQARLAERPSPVNLMTTTTSTTVAPAATTSTTSPPQSTTSSTTAPTTTSTTTAPRTTTTTSAPTTTTEPPSTTTTTAAPTTTTAPPSSTTTTPQS